jgi:homospermidine synthase
MDFSRLTIIDFEDLRHTIPEVLSAGAGYVQERISAHNYPSVLGQYLGPGDLLIDLAWSIDTGDIIQWCHAHQVLYLNTSVEEWDPYRDVENTPPPDKSLYALHMALRKRTASWPEPGATAVVEHGANPGLVSHWTKVALEDIAHALLQRNLAPERQAALARALSDADYARVAMLSGVKVIHISERDTQICDKPKQVNEFVNTWSVAAFYEESIAPSEIGWGMHERRLPSGALSQPYGPRNYLSLSRMGMDTLVRSWLPMGEIIGMVIRHAETFTISEHLTVWQDDVPIYRPTVTYAYLPCDAALASLHEMRMSNCQLQPNHRIMSDEIVSGRDELGVLLLGHDLNGWWVGSQLDIHEARRLVPHQNATTLQVSASVLGALFWVIRHPRRGLCVPDELPHREVLAVANPYLGPCPSLQTDWTPLKNRIDPFEKFGRPRPCEEDVWQFETFLV